MSTQQHASDVLGKDMHKAGSNIIGGQQQHQGNIGIGGGRDSGIHRDVNRDMQRGAAETKDQLMCQAEQGMEQVKKVGENISNMACDVCHNWRHYPKLLTGLLLLSTFLIGASSLAMVQKVGIIGGGSGNYVSQHWDRETADAHHALDVVLDHLQHPSLYRSEKSESYVNKARKSLFNLFDGIMPSSRSSSTSNIKSQANKGRDYAGRKGQDVYDDARDTGRNFYDKAADMKDDIAYKTRRGVDTVKDSAYDLTHNIGSKISDIAGNVKHSLVGDNDDDSYLSRSRSSDRYSSAPSTWQKVVPTWLGGVDDDSSFGGRSSNRHLDVMRRGNTDDDEFEHAASKLQHIGRQAKREL